MADTQISRIYDVRTTGVGGVIGDLDTIKARFDAIAQAKRQMSDMKMMAYDPDAIEKLNGQMAKLSDQQALQIQQMKDMAVATQQNAKAQAELAEARMKAFEAQKGVTANMQPASARLGDDTYGATANMGKMQAALADMARFGEGYNAVIGAMQRKLAGLREQLSITQAALNLLQRQYDQGLVVWEKYNGENSRLLSHLEEQKAQIAEVTVGMTALSKLYVPVSEDRTGSGVVDENSIVLQQQEGAAIEAATQQRQDASDKMQMLRKQTDDLNISTRQDVELQKELADVIRVLKVLLEDMAQIISQGINIDGLQEVVIELSQLQEQLTEIGGNGEQGTEVFRQVKDSIDAVADSMKNMGEASQSAMSFTDSFGRILDSVTADADGMAIALAAVKEGIKYVMEWLKEQGKAEDNILSSKKKFHEQLTEIDASRSATVGIDEDRARALLKIAEDETIAYDKRMEAAQKFRASNEIWEDKFTDKDIMEGKASKWRDDVDDPVKVKAQLDADKEALDLSEAHLKKANTDLQVQKARKERHDAGKGAHSDPKSAVEDEYAEGAYNAAFWAQDDAYEEHEKRREAYEKSLTKWLRKTHPAHEGKTIQEMRVELKSLKEQQANANGEQLQILNKQIESLERQIREAKGSQINRQRKVRDKTAIKEYDYTRDVEDATEKLNAFVAKAAEERMRMEMSGEKRTFNDEKVVLADRLTAYAIYADDLKHIQQKQYEQEVDGVQVKIDKIAEIEKQVENMRHNLSYDKSFFDNSGKLKQSLQKLLFQKKELEAQLDLIETTFKGKMEQAALKINTDIAEITKSSFEKVFSEIDKNVSKGASAIDRKAEQAKGRVYSEGGSVSHKRKKNEKIEYQKKIDKEQNEIDGIDDRWRQTSLDIGFLSLQAEQSEQTIELRNRLWNDLDKLDEERSGRQLALDNKKKEHDLALQEDTEKTRQKIMKRGLDVAQSFANDYMQLLQKRDAYEAKMAERQLNWNEKLRGATAQSKQDELKNEKAIQMQRDQLAREQAEKNKKRAEQQMAIDYAVAVMQIIAANAWNFETAGAVEIAAITAIYAAKLAMLNAAPAYAQGTNSHPGGWAWVGDGGEHELIRASGSMYVSPATATLMSLPKGAEVMPFSRVADYRGTYSSQVTAPNFAPYVQGHGGGAGMGAGAGVGAGLLEDVKQVMYTAAAGMASMKVSLDTRATGRAIDNNHHKKVSIR